MALHPTICEVPVMEGELRGGKAEEEVCLGAAESLQGIG